MPAPGALDAAALTAAINAGERPREDALISVLRQPSCPRRLVEVLAEARWVLRLRRALPLVVRHPGCPRPFALEAISRLPWRDLLDVARFVRAAPPIRRQAERKLIERVPQLTAGERVALARLAPRAVIGAMLATEETACACALLDNPQFTESDAVRLLLLNHDGGCVAAVVRHRVWGTRPGVVRAALHSRCLALGLALGLVAQLASGELEAVASSPDIDDVVRNAARQLLARRDGAPGP